MTGIALIPSPHRRPRVRQQRRNESLELEPRAGRVRANLEGDAFAEEIDGQLEILWAGGGKWQRREGCRIRFVVDEGGEVQVPCPFGVEGEVGEEFPVRADLIGLFEIVAQEKV